MLVKITILWIDWEDDEYLDYGSRHVLYNPLASFITAASARSLGLVTKAGLTPPSIACIPPSESCRHEDLAAEIMTYDGLHVLPLRNISGKKLNIITIFP